MSFGATIEEWDAFARLIVKDLLPTVCDPNVPVSAGSRIHQDAAVPSIVLGSNEKVGLANWTKKHTASVDDWKLDPRLGICLITRTIHAIDVDVTDPELAQRVEAFIRLNAPGGFAMPKRGREGTSKFALLYRLVEAPEVVKKTVIQVSADGTQQVEFLHHLQQLVVAGTNIRRGGRYLWPDGIPARLSDVPALTFTELAELHRDIAREFLPDGAIRELTLGDQITIAVGHRNRLQVDYEKDPILKRIMDQGLFRGLAPDGKVYVHCPWRDEHKHPTPENETEAAYFPIGLGGHDEHPGFKCMHATCAERTHQGFLNAIGYGDDEFPVSVTPKSVQTRPQFVYKGKSQLIAPTISNITKMLTWSDGTGYEFFYDSFLDQLCYMRDGMVEKVDDDTYTEVRLMLAALGIEDGGGKETVRDAISYVAKQNMRDAAIMWLNDLRWDGVRRLDSFHTRVLKLQDTPYHRAVMDYMWSAMVGRVLVPGIKADMVPILIGTQGLRKSTFAKALPPTIEEFVEIDLSTRDADLVRILRGKLIAEWAELRGLTARDADATKGWISQCKDEWTPKFKEFGAMRLRRFMIIGTANRKRIANDPTGGRRWLPLFLQHVIDTEYVEQHRDQLWAEARTQFEQNNRQVQWERAEELAKPYLEAISERDVWTDIVKAYLADHQGVEGWTTSQLLQIACSLPPSQLNRTNQDRMYRVMNSLGWKEEADGRWYFAFT